MPEEVDALLAALPYQLRPLVQIMTLTALRIGEALAMQCDFENPDSAESRSRRGADCDEIGICTGSARMGPTARHTKAIFGRRSAGA